MLLLAHPDAHNEFVRQQFDSEYLQFHSERMQRRILFLFHIFQRLRDDLLGSEHNGIICDGFRIGGRGAVKKLRFCPERADRETAYASVAKFNVQRAGII